MRPFSVVAVCTGNICRSPMAEAVLRDRFESAGLGDRVTVASAGVSGEEEGEPIDPRAAAVLRERGYTLPGHVAHRITADEVASGDLLLAMTSVHADRLRAAGAQPDRVRLYRSFDPAADGTEIADPWYGDRDAFRAALDEIEAGADGVVATVRERL